MRHNFTFVSALIAGTCLLASSAHAGPMSGKLSRLLAEHNLMHASQESLNAAKARIAVEEGSRLPTISAGGSIGNEWYDRDSGTDTDLLTRELNLSLTQRVWDFGATSASIDRAGFAARLAEAELHRQANKLLLAGLEAEQNLRNALVILEYAEDSERNIKNQTRLENTRIDSGRGYETDLLQAKSQLAAAEARKVAAIGNMEKARNRYQAIFGYNSTFPTTTENLVVPPEYIPRTLQEALDSASRRQSDLHVSRAEVDLSRANLREANTAAYLPELDFVASYDNNHNTDGVDADTEITSVALQFSWDYELGGQQGNRIAAATHSTIASEQTHLNKERQVTEDIRNVWIQLKTAEARLAHLENQALISQQFLELAREERELGRRSLLDVLSGETSLINAKSEAGAARSEMIVAQLQLLSHVGRLDINTF